MASFQFITSTKVKLYAEFGYRQDGTRARRTKTVTVKTPNSKRAAQKALDVFIAEASAKKDPVKRITFKKFTAEWLDLHVSKLHEGTKENYEKCLRNGIMDCLGEKQISAIKPFHILRFFKDEEEKGHGMAKEKYVALSSIFSHALKWDVIKANPMDKVDQEDIPKPKKRDWNQKWYNAKELAFMLGTLEKEKRMRKWTKIMFKLAALVGLRESEIVGLRNDAIDFTHNSIVIDRQLVWSKKEKRFYLGETKSGRARTVYVPNKFMQGEFKDYVAWHNKVRKQCEDAWYSFVDPKFSLEPINLIFTHHHGHPIFATQLCHAWIEFVKRAELPRLNFHGLRHSCLSYQINHGALVMDVQRQAGHSSSEITTQIYGHAEESGRQAAADLMDNLF